MKIALVTLNDSTDVHEWSGLNYFIARALEQAGARVVRVGPLESRWTLAMRLRQRWYDAIGRAYHAVMDPASLAALGASARAAIPGDADAVLSVTSLVAAAVGRIAVPHVSWDDATPAAMDEYYPDYQHMAPVSRLHSAQLGRRAVEAVDLAVYASGWAAESARAAYGLSREQTAVVPFGANLEPLPAHEDVERAIAQRGREPCRLLWIGVEWQRKGGPLTLATAGALRDAGVNLELTLVGCTPDHGDALPPWVRTEGFISKGDAAGRARLAELFSRADFFVMPSHAEAFGLVYAEASAFGVPSVALRTGGVPTVVLHDATGILAEPGSSGASIAREIEAIYRDRPRYVAMARAARAHAISTLNWEAAGRAMVAHIERLVT